MNDFNNLFAGISWIASTVGAIIISILANILTGPFQNLLARLNGNRSKKRISQLKHYLDEVESLIQNPLNMYTYTFCLILKISIVILIAFALGDVIAASVTASYKLTSVVRYNSEYFYSAGQLVTSILYLMALNYALSGYRIISAARNFPKLKRRMEGTITSLDESVK
jgi:hypothetical protein